MHLTRYLWLLLCYAQNACSDDLEVYEKIANEILFPYEENNTGNSIIQVDETSGCICGVRSRESLVVCYGNYKCKRFPKVKSRSNTLRVRTSAIKRINKEDIEPLYYLRVLEIEANYQLTHLESGLFRNLSKLEQLSISYNTYLTTLDENIFEGLTSLKNLTLVSNGFRDIMKLTSALRPSILPALKGLDLSENDLGKISEQAFWPMRGTLLKRLAIRLSRLDFIHPNCFSPLKMLQTLHVGDNDLNATLIEAFLYSMAEKGINLTDLDLSGMGFRRHVPIPLLKAVATTTIKRLTLARNQFEILGNDEFPFMPYLEILDLRKSLIFEIGSYTFEPAKFPRLQVLLLGGNNLQGLHRQHLSDQLLYLDISAVRRNPESSSYFEIDKNTFMHSRELRVLNLAYNNIRALYDYSFSGLENLKVLNLENGTLYYIGSGTFKPTKSLEMLNMANNPLAVSQNLSGVQFKGLNELKVLNLKNCGINILNDNDNIFEMMPNLTHLTLRNNKLLYITAETLKPMKFLRYLDLSGNLIVAWWQPLFLAAGVKPRQLYLTNNKISHFSLSMILDIGYLLVNSSGTVDLMNNIFDCDCSTMYNTYVWLEEYGSVELKDYFNNSNFQCSSPELWEDRKISEYVMTMKKKFRCMTFNKFSSLTILSWSAPTLVTIFFVMVLGIGVFKYRIYIKYWLFLAKLAIGKQFLRKSTSTNMKKPEYKYDAFVSYSNENRGFIMELVHQLEETSPYLKLCIYERDFEIGSVISESVVKSMTESRYIILIISNSFAKSQWCRWETQLADYHRLVLDDGTNYDPLILVKVGDIESKYMTATLKYLLKTKIYLSWNEQTTDMFWKKLRRVLDSK